MRLPRYFGRLGNHVKALQPYGGKVPMPGLLIQKPKHPQGNAVAATVFSVVNHEIGIVSLRNLLAAFPLPTNLKGVFPIDDKIAYGRELHSMRIAELVGKKSLP